MDGLRYLSEADVAAAAPPPLEAVDLAARALRAVASGRVELPPKMRLRYRATPDAHADAMPAFAADAGLLGLKWIAVDQANPSRGVPALHGLVVLTDAATALPRCILGARTLTALRTAAVSGAAIRALAPAGATRVALVGTGEEARTHLAVLDALGLRDVAVLGRSAASVAALEAWCSAHVPGVRLTAAGTIAEACRGAGVVVTVVSQHATGCRIEEAWLEPGALLVPVDHATCVGADLAERRLLVADAPAQFRVLREAGANLDGYRDPDGATGDHLDGPRPAGGIVVQNLGNGVSDLFLADAVARRAAERGLGVALPV